MRSKSASRVRSVWRESAAVRAMRRSTRAACVPRRASAKRASAIRGQASGGSGRRSTPSKADWRVSNSLRDRAPERTSATTGPHTATRSASSAASRRVTIRAFPRKNSTQTEESTRRSLTKGGDATFRRRCGCPFAPRAASDPPSSPFEGVPEGLPRPLLAWSRGERPCGRPREALRGGRRWSSCTKHRNSLLFMQGGREDPLRMKKAGGSPRPPLPFEEEPAFSFRIAVRPGPE